MNSCRSYYITAICKRHQGLKIFSLRRCCLVDDGLNKAHAPEPRLAFVSIHIGTHPGTAVRLVLYHQFKGTLSKVNVGCTYHQFPQVPPLWFRSKSCGHWLAKH